MAFIEKLTGMTSPDSCYLATVRASDGNITSITPINDANPTLVAAPDPAPIVNVRPEMKRLLDKAGLATHTAGKPMTRAQVDEKLTAANLTTDERFRVKNLLSDRGLVEVGTKLNFV